VLWGSHLRGPLRVTAAIEAAEVNRTVREYLEELAAQNPTPEIPEAGSQETSDKVIAMLPEILSTTDPDATWSGKNGPYHLLGYAR